MRVGLVSPDFFPPESGLGAYAYELYHRLSDQGVEPVVLTIRSAPVPRIAYLRATGPTNFSIKVSLRLSAFVRSSGVDLLHLVGGPEGALPFTRPSKPLIYTVPSLFAHHRASLRLSARQALAMALLQVVEQRSYRMASHLVAPSLGVRQTLTEQYGVAPDRVTALPTGVDLETFHPSEGDREPGRLLYVGGLLPRKGLRRLLEAMGEIVRVVPSARLTVVGESQRGYQIIRWAGELGLEGHVQVVERLSWEEMVEEYQRAELLIVPSLAGGLARTCLEAMACGLPVVGARVPGVADVVGDGATGVLVPPGDGDALAGAVIALLKDSRRRHLLGKQGRAMVEERHDWASLMPQILSLYQQALERKG